MKQLTVLSGKGGTGKTTVAAALIQLTGEAVIADCDVEAPNLHLLLAPRIDRSYPLSVSSKAHIDEELCTACGLCEEECRFGAIRGCKVNLFSCEGCGLCRHLCTAGAVSMVEEEGAEVFLGETPYGPMVWARLAMGEEASGRVVTQVRMEAQAIVAEGGPELIISDGSPGIGCPVIASVTGSNLVLMVAEPTISGRHDLERALEMSSFFNVPCLVCINKADINAGEAARIRAYCDSRGIEVAVEIPYCDGLAEAARRSRPPLEYTDESITRLFRRLHARVMEKTGMERQAPVSD
jgi:MinD superfamily P-loop ATPase